MADHVRADRKDPCGCGTNRAYVINRNQNPATELIAVATNSFLNTDRNVPGRNHSSHDTNPAGGTGITRRTALFAGLATSFLAVANWSPVAFAQSGGFPSPLMIVVHGVDTNSDFIQLATFIDPFLIRMIPITISVNPFDDNGAALSHNSLLGNWMRLYRFRYPTLVEFGIHAETIVSPDPYFQLRQISDAQNALTLLVNDFDRTRLKSLSSAVTVTTNTPLRSQQDCASLRGAGIRAVVHLPGWAKGTKSLEPMQGGYWFTNTGLANTFASIKTDLGSVDGMLLERSKLANNVLDLSQHRNPIFIAMSMDSLAKVNAVDTATYATEVAIEISQGDVSGKVRNILPRTLYAQSRGKRNRFVVVRLDDFRISRDADVIHQSLSADLVKRGYPFTDLVIPAPQNQLLSNDTADSAYLKGIMLNASVDIGTHGWNHTSEELKSKSVQSDTEIITRGIKEVFQSTGHIPISYVPPNDAFDENTLAALAHTGTAIFSAERGDYQWISGLDSNGLIHASNTTMFEQSWDGDVPYHETHRVLENLGTDDDAVFSIHPQTANSPEKRKRILDTLEALSAQPGTTLVNFQQYYDSILPPLPKFEQIRQARTEVVLKDLPAKILDLADKRLMDDAALAWKYFDWGMNEFGGMVPATSWIEYGKQKGYPFTTMWDVGTYINATVCAHQLDLINQLKFESIVDRILAFLGASNFRFGNAKLPHAERPLASAGNQREGFDSADAGRLLIALKILDAKTNGSFPVAKTISKWNFQPVLKNGEMHGVTGRGRLRSSHATSYGEYASQGYKLWGYHVKPVFDTQDPIGNMDDAVQALNEIQRRGRISTEPHITAEIELGGSPHGRFMADILYAAQIKRHRDTGILTAVSESPVAGIPYFTYQGFQVNDSGGQFVVDVQETSAAEIERTQREELRLVSSKAAYLWYAARPGAYSEELLALVRQQGPMGGMGFASGIFEHSGRRTEVTDLNTNGIILESISYILGGRKPFYVPRKD